MSPPRRVAVIATSSGQGKTTFARELGRRLGIAHVELDALMHGPGWVAAPDFTERVEEALAGEAWVIDGGYFGLLGSRVLDAAELIVWFDLPARVWFPRLLRRTLRRILTREVLWNGNRETWRGAFWGRESLWGWTLGTVAVTRRELPARLAGRPVRRLGSDADARTLLRELAP